MRNRATLLLSLAIAIVLCVGCSERHRFEGVNLRRLVPADYVDMVRESLEIAGENWDEMLAALEQVEEPDREAMAYLVAYLPPVDLATADRGILLDTVESARDARARFPWGPSVPEDIYLSYVLPPRVSQEPLESWRPFLLDALTERLEGIQSMEEAALAVNRWCGERVTYKPTQRRDQGVFETLASGYGRCEEMMIVHISALRSVGIPARQTWTPYWATADNNHAWTELWVDGRWRYTGACEPRDALDQSWFTETVKGAAVVLSSVFGRPASDDEVYLEEERFAIVNSVSRYLEPGRLTVSVTESGRPVNDLPVTVSVWNFGCLRQVARQETDRAGTASVTLGDGTYFVSAGGPGSSAWELCEIRESEETRVDLALEPDASFDASFRLVYSKRSGAEAGEGDG